MTTADCGFNTLGTTSGADLLVRTGPTISVDIGFDKNWAPNCGKAPKPSVSGVGALIDTGATESCIDKALASKLNLTIIDKKKIFGSNGEHEVNVHLAQIHVPKLDLTVYGSFAAVDLAAGGQTHQAILGRTFLRNLIMNYDGKTGKVTLTYNKPQLLLPGLGGAPLKPTPTV